MGESINIEDVLKMDVDELQDPEPAQPVGSEPSKDPVDLPKPKRKYTVTEKVGRPALYKTVEQLEKAVEAYFAEEGPHGMAGLAYALGMNRMALLNYSKTTGKKKFIYTIKKAREKIEAEVEKRLQSGGNPAGLIFNLTNNFGWQQPTSKIESKNQNTNETTIHSSLTDEELESKLLLFETKEKSCQHQDVTQKQAG
jgi:hypothetical protein